MEILQTHAILLIKHQISRIKYSFAANNVLQVQKYGVQNVHIYNVIAGWIYIPLEEILQKSLITNIWLLEKTSQKNRLSISPRTNLFVISM